MAFTSQRLNLWPQIHLLAGHVLGVCPVLRGGAVGGLSDSPAVLLDMSWSLQWVEPSPGVACFSGGASGLAAEVHSLDGMQTYDQVVME